MYYICAHAPYLPGYQIKKDSHVNDAIFYYWGYWGDRDRYWPIVESIEPPTLTLTLFAQLTLTLTITQTLNLMNGPGNLSKQFSGYTITLCWR